MRKILYIPIVLFLTAILLYGQSLLSIYFYYKHAGPVKSDAIIVLGAAAWGKKPSPVLRERLNHAINLYKGGWADYIIFTGGKGFPQEAGESIISRKYAVGKGVPESRTLVENVSRNTFQNLYYAKMLAEKNGLNSFIVVSDHFHLKRAAIIAESLGFSVSASPTPTTRFSGKEKKLIFLFKEAYLLLSYRMEALVDPEHLHFIRQ